MDSNGFNQYRTESCIYMSVLDKIKNEIKAACTDNYGNAKDISYEHIMYIINKNIGKDR